MADNLDHGEEQKPTYIIKDPTSAFRMKKVEAKEAADFLKNYVNIIVQYYDIKYIIYIKLYNF